MRKSDALLLVILLSGPPLVEATLESGISAFEAREWPRAIHEFLQLLQEDPTNAEAHAYVTLSSKHLNEDRQSLLRRERSEILSAAVKMAEQDPSTARVLTDALSETSSAADQAQRERWRARCEEARAQRLSGRWITAHALLFEVLAENSAFPEAQRELSELQSRVRSLLDQGDGASIEDRFTLEGFYAFGQADYATAIVAWRKLRTLLEQNATTSDRATRMQRLRFEPFEAIAKAQLAEDQRKVDLRRLFEEGVALSQKRRWSEALVALRKLAIQDPEYPELGVSLVRAEAAIEKDRTDRLGNQKQEEVDKLLHSGQLALEKQSLADAEAYFERVLKLDPSHAAAQSYLQMARAELKRLHDPQAAQMHYEAGLVAYASGKLDEALREWRMTTRMNPAHEKARLALGKVQKELAMNHDREVLDETIP